MPNIKSTAEIAEKWARVTPSRREDYENGVRNPRTDWESATAEAENRYNEGVQNAIARGGFGKGVRAAGTAKWKENAVKLGSRRWPEGVSAGKDSYSKGFAPYAQVISSTSLPPKFPKGDPRNIDRVAAMAKAMRDTKEAMS